MKINLTLDQANCLMNLCKNRYKELENIADEDRTASQHEELQILEYTMHAINKA